jgi:lipopolysaccharide/colanic/teichoic acid biosynthesis glycosyltransferase
MIGGKKVLTTGYVSVTFNQMVIKRFIDIIGGIVGCFFAGLIILFIGPIIYIQSPGPIIFKQIRVGRNGKKFKFYKLRSMRVDADEIKKRYESENKSKDGFMFKMDFDPRIIGNRILPNGTKKTGIGQFIRKTSLDEFPQFFNVLKGDMSLVGTRPPTLDEWEKYDYHHRARLTMQPGITGLWQTSGRSNVMDFEEVVKLDTKYIANFSIRGDIKILGKTVLGMLKRDGAV